MSKHKHKKSSYSQHHAGNLRTLTALQDQAHVKCNVLGHLLGRWGPAKHKHGANAMKALCVGCGEQVIIMPRHYHDPKNQQVPAIAGDLLFQRCVTSNDCQAS